ncbi:MAG: helix-turn-helix transcriptional regulator [Myxococcota bacterium]
MRTARGDALRLDAGEHLIVRAGLGVEVTRSTALGSVLLFSCPRETLGQILGFLGAPGEVDGEPLCLVPPRSRAGRRLARILNEADGRQPRGRTRAGDELGRFAHRLSLISAILEAEGAPLAPRDRRQAGSRRRVPEAARALRESDPDDWCLSSFAERLGLSTRQVSRLFQEELGLTFREYVTELRLERASQLLARTDRSITEVAFESGWRSLSHFTTVFREKVGITPRAYRRAYEAGAERPGAAGSADLPPDDAGGASGLETRLASARPPEADPPTRRASRASGG